MFTTKTPPPIHLHKYTAPPTQRQQSGFIRKVVQLNPQQAKATTPRPSALLRFMLYLCFSTARWQVHDDALYLRSLARSRWVCSSPEHANDLAGGLISQSHTAEGVPKTEALCLIRLGVEIEPGTQSLLLYYAILYTDGHFGKNKPLVCSQQHFARTLRTFNTE